MIPAFHYSVALRAIAFNICFCFLLHQGACAEDFAKAQELTKQAITLASQGKYEESMALNKQALDLDPKSASILFNIGKLYQKWKLDYSTAKSYYEQALTINPKLIEAWNMHGICCKRLNNMKAAENSFQQALKLDPNHYDSLCNLGYFYFNSGRYKDSREILERANKLAQASNDNDLAEFLDKLDKLERAK